MADYRWYVAAALAGLEATAIYHLSRAGIAGYAPTLADRAARYFPGYVFVELEGPWEAGAVNRTRGIHRMLPIHADSPLALPTGFVEEFREKVAADGLKGDDEGAFLRRFVPGIDEVSAVGNYPLRDGHGRFLRYRKGAGIVLGYLLGREVEIPIPLHKLEVVGKGQARALAA